MFFRRCALFSVNTFNREQIQDAILFVSFSLCLQWVLLTLPN